MPSAVAFWAQKRDAERYEQNAYPKVAEMLKPYLATPTTLKHYAVETSTGSTFMKAFAA